MAEKNNGIVVSSDSIREELYGDESIQGNGNKVFSIMFKRTVEAYMIGKEVYYDATNLVRKRRCALVRNFIEKGVKNRDICYIVVATPFEVCLENNRKRSRKVPEEVIYKMRENYEPLSPDEGEALLVYPFGNAGICSCEEDISSRNKELQRNDIPHDNPNHALGVKDHMLAAYDYLKENIPRRFEKDRVDDLLAAALLHDIGKVDVKSFVDSRDNPCEKARYYNHENVGAYNSLFCLYSLPDYRALLISALIGYHMLPYSYHIDDNEIVRQKLLNKFKDKSWFVDELMLIHEADVAAH